MAIQKLRKLLKAKQVAEYLGIHEQTLYDLVEKKAIPHRRIGKDDKGGIRFNPSEIIDWHRQDVQPKVINYQPPITMVGAGKINFKEESKMRKGSSKPLQGRWNTESGTIFTRVTSKQTGERVRYCGLYYDAKGKLREKVLKNARTYDQAVIELNDIYDNEFRAKHHIPAKNKGATLGEFVAENKISSRIRKEMVKYFGGKWLHEITELEVLAYVRQREQDGAKNNTINNELIALRKTLYLAKRGRYGIDDLIKWGNCMKRMESRERICSDEERERLMPTLAEHLKGIFICALKAGMRKGEILSLKWKNIVDGEIVLEAQNTKTKKQRRIPIHSTLQQVFEILKSRNGFSEFVFTYRGKEIKDIGNAFSKACKRAGIEDLHFHDLRRTFATTLVKNGVDLYTLQKILGHAKITTTMLYVNYQPVNEARKAIDSLVDNKEDKSSLIQGGLLEKPMDIRGMQEDEQLQLPLLPLVTSRAS